MQGGTGQGERVKRQRTQCGTGRESAVDVWSGECGEYRGERNGTATQGSMGMEEAGGGIGGSERKDRGRGPNRAYVREGCQHIVGSIVCARGQAEQ